MKKFYFLLLAAMFSVGVYAQRIILWSENQVLYQQSITMIDSITFLDESTPGLIAPYYIGAISDFDIVHDFSDNSNHGEFITSHVGTGATSTIKMMCYMEEVPQSIPNVTPYGILEDALQLILAVPAEQLPANDWVVSVYSFEEWKNMDNASFKSNYGTESHPEYGDSITINGIAYKVFTLTGQRRSKIFLSGDSFTITLNK